MSPECQLEKHNGGRVNVVLRKICTLVTAAVVAASSLLDSSNASAEEPPSSFMPHGSISLATPYVSTTYRKAGGFSFRLDAPKLGPVTPSATATLLGNNAGALFPSAQLNLASRVAIISRNRGKSPLLALDPVVSAGVQGFATGLDNPKTTDYIAAPFVSGSLGLPVSVDIDSEKDTLLTITPSVNFARYLRGNDISLKMDDKNGDGKPDFTRPVQQFYYGLTAGMNFDKNFIGASLFCDPSDPTVKSGAQSVWGLLSAGRKF